MIGLNGTTGTSTTAATDILESSYQINSKHMKPIIPPRWTHYQVCQQTFMMM